jgi:hypothetical protein
MLINHIKNNKLIGINLLQLGVFQVESHHLQDKKDLEQANHIL